MVELTLHAPWFLLSAEIIDADIPDRSMTRTLCIAWDNDLVDILSSLDADRVTGIVCMMPAWQSVSGQWSSREVQEVWLSTSAAGRSVLFCDAAGQKFDCGLTVEHEGEVAMDLLLRVRCKSRTRQRRRAARAGKRTA